MTVLKLTTIGTSTGVIIPKAMLDRMNVGKGDVLYAVEAPDGSYRLTPYDPAYQASLAAAHAGISVQAGAAHPPAMDLGSLYNSLIKQSNLLAYVDTFRCLALLSFVMIPVVFLLKRVSKKGMVSVD